VQKSELLRELQKEIQRHDLSTFVDDPPSVAQGGKGVVPGRRSASAHGLFITSNYCFQKRRDASRPAEERLRNSCNRVTGESAF
jgi:hypothetical protein